MRKISTTDENLFIPWEALICDSDVLHIEQLKRISDKNKWLKSLMFTSRLYKTNIKLVCINKQNIHK
jgi:hypothetical protein